MKQRFIFDLDGTLLYGDFSKEIKYFKNTLGKDSEKFLSEYQELLLEYENTHLKYDTEDLSNYYKNKIGINITSEIIDGWVKVNAKMSDKLLDETKSMLEYLKSKDKSLVVLTNWFKYTQEERLRNAGILEFFDGVYAGDLNLKPNKESYLYACGNFCIDECIMKSYNVYLALID